MTGTTLRDELAAALERAAPGLGARLEEDPAAYLDLVRLLREAQDATGGMLRDAVASARAAGASWADVGGVLGMTRQAAQQRFGGPGRPVPPESGDRRVLAPLTAFNEMRVLDRAGRYGWHSVEYGAFHHVVERDDRQWEHARTSFGPPTGYGWRRVGAGWAWWTYWARPLDAAPVPGDPSTAELVHG